MYSLAIIVELGSRLCTSPLLPISSSSKACFGTGIGAMREILVRLVILHSALRPLLVVLGVCSSQSVGVQT
jgi:hypothetical protein